MSQKSNLEIFQNARFYLLNADQNITIIIVTIILLLLLDTRIIPISLATFQLFAETWILYSQLCGYFMVSLYLILSIFNNWKFKKLVLEFRRKSLDLKADCQWYIRILTRHKYTFIRKLQGKQSLFGFWKTVFQSSP